MRARTVEPVFGQLEDLPETDHDVPARPRRVRKRMAARLAAHNLRKLHRQRAES
jgi:hypothetical protein